MLIELVKAYGIVPVLVLEEEQRARRIGELLVENNLPIVELTLRTSSAFRSLQELAKNNRLCVGVGSVQSVDQLKKAHSLGAQFAVSAGFNNKLVATAADLGMDYLPGVATPTEILSAVDNGIEVVKWFPAEALGGIKTLNAISAPFPNVKFVPTGGITRVSRFEYLALDAVIGIGGSWMFSKSQQDNEYFNDLRESLTEISK